MSSGNGHPPDKPYQVITLDDNDDMATAQLKAARDAGFEVLFVVPWQRQTSGGTFEFATRVIVGSYKGKP